MNSPTQKGGLADLVTM